MFELPTCLNSQPKGFFSAVQCRSNLHGTFCNSRSARCMSTRSRKMMNQLYNSTEVADHLRCNRSDYFYDIICKVSGLDNQYKKLEDLFSSCDFQNTRSSGYKRNFKYLTDDLLYLDLAVQSLFKFIKELKRELYSQADCFEMRECERNNYTTTMIKVLENKSYNLLRKLEDFKMKFLQRKSRNNNSKSITNINKQIWSSCVLQGRNMSCNLCSVGNYCGQCNLCSSGKRNSYSRNVYGPCNSSKGFVKYHTDSQECVSPPNLREYCEYTIVENDKQKNIQPKLSVFLREGNKYQGQREMHKQKKTYRQPRWKSSSSTIFMAIDSSVYKHKGNKLKKYNKSSSQQGVSSSQIFIGDIRQKSSKTYSKRSELIVSDSSDSGSMLDSGQSVIIDAENNPRRKEVRWFYTKPEQNNSGLTLILNGKNKLIEEKDSKSGKITYSKIRLRKLSNVSVVTSDVYSLLTSKSQTNKHNQYMDFNKSSPKTKIQLNNVGDQSRICTPKYFANNIRSNRMNVLHKEGFRVHSEICYRDVSDYNKNKYCYCKQCITCQCKQNPCLCHVDTCNPTSNDYTRYYENIPPRNCESIYPIMEPNQFCPQECEYLGNLKCEPDIEIIPICPAVGDNCPDYNTSQFYQRRTKTTKRKPKYKGSLILETKDPKKSISKQRENYIKTKLYDLSCSKPRIISSEEWISVRKRKSKYRRKHSDKMEKETESSIKIVLKQGSTSIGDGTCQSKEDSYNYIFFKREPSPKYRRRYIRLGKLSRTFSKTVIEYDIPTPPEKQIPPTISTATKMYSRGTSPELISLYTKRTSTTGLIKSTKGIGTNTRTVTTREQGVEPIPQKKKSQIDKIVQYDVLKHDKNISVSAPIERETYTRGTTTKPITLYGKITSTSELKKRITTTGTNTRAISTLERGIDPIPQKEKSKIPVETKTEFTNTENISTRSIGIDSMPLKPKPKMKDIATEPLDYLGEKDKQTRSIGIDCMPLKPKPKMNDVGTDPLYYLGQKNKQTNTMPRKKPDLRTTGTDSKPLEIVEQTTRGTDPPPNLEHKDKHTSTIPIITVDTAIGTLPKPVPISKRTDPLALQTWDKKTSYDKVKCIERGNNPISIQMLNKTQQFDTVAHKPKVKNVHTETDLRKVKPLTSNVDTQTKRKRLKPLVKQFPATPILRKPRTIDIPVASEKTHSYHPQCATPSELSMHLTFTKSHEAIYRNRKHIAKPLYLSKLDCKNKFIVCERKRSNSIRITHKSKCNQKDNITPTTNLELSLKTSRACKSADTSKSIRYATKPISSIHYKHISSSHIRIPKLSTHCGMKIKVKSNKQSHISLKKNYDELENKKNSDSTVLIYNWKDVVNKVKNDHYTLT